MEKVFTILKVFLIFEKVFSRNIVVSDQGAERGWRQRVSLPLVVADPSASLRMPDVACSALVL